MKTLSHGSAALMAVLALAGALACGDTAEPEQEAAVEPAKNTLTSEEKADGWVLLFDGESTRGWTGWNQQSFPESGWDVNGGDLVVFASDGSQAGLGGDIVSDAVFSDFELVFDFQVSPVGNSGVFYRVVEHEGRDLWHALHGRSPAIKGGLQAGIVRRGKDEVIVQARRLRQSDAGAAI